MKPTPWHELNVGDIGIQYWTEAREVETFIVVNKTSERIHFSILDDDAFSYSLKNEGKQLLVFYYKTGHINIEDIPIENLPSKESLSDILI